MDLFYLSEILDSLSERTSYPLYYVYSESMIFWN